MKLNFRRFASVVSSVAGSAHIFILALFVVIAWGVTGPLFGFSNTWQLVINTATTVITFLMVFLIQNTQNRDSKAMQLKLDELIRATKARDSFIDIEDLSDEELAYVTDEFRKMHDATENPVHAKLQRKLQAARKRRSALSEAAEAATQVVNMLNPFDQQGPKKNGR